MSELYPKGDTSTTGYFNRGYFNSYGAGSTPADFVDLPLQPEAGQRITALWNAELNLPPVVRDFSHQITDTIHRMHTGQNPLIVTRYHPD